MNDAQTQVIRDRSTWAREQEAIIAAAIAKLSAQAIEDFRHQAVVRGIGFTSGSYREAQAGIAAATATIADRAKDNLMGWVADSGIKLR